MTPQAKSRKYDHFRKSLAAAGLELDSSRSLVCPLCWQETPYDDLSLEHIVPASVGGKLTTLTCRRCNNEHGHSLDAHLAQFQSTRDAFAGCGTLKTKLNVNGHEMIANLEWGDGSKTFHVVGKATNPAAIDASRRQLADGGVEQFACTLYIDYAKNRIQTAVLRAAYLVLFKCFGYEYAHHEIVQAVRRRIADPSLTSPQIGHLVFEARNFVPPFDEQHYVVPGNVNGVEFFLVIIRVRRETTTYPGAYLPVPVGRCDEFFALMGRVSTEQDGQTLAVPRELVFG